MNQEKSSFENQYTYPFRFKDGRYKPIIPIKLANFFNDKSINVTALIDTGSETCVFPEYLTTSIGYKLNEASRKAKGIRGVKGEEIETHVNGFKIYVLDPQEKEVVRILEVVGNIVKTPALVPILGTERFSEFFSIEFNYLEKTITLKW